MRRLKIEAEEEAKEATRGGNTLVVEAKRMNFVFLYGCKPSAGVKANTTMVKDILNALMLNADRINFMVQLPQALD